MRRISEPTDMTFLPHRRSLGALERGDAAHYVELTRRRVEESGGAAVRQLTSIHPRPKGGFKELFF